MTDTERLDWLERMAASDALGMRLHTGKTPPPRIDGRVMLGLNIEIAKRGGVGRKVDIRKAIDRCR